MTLDESVPVEDIDNAAPVEERRRIPLGLVAFAIAVVLAIGEVIAISLANSGHPAEATFIGRVLVFLTALPLVLGLYAVVRGSNRGWGIAAMIVAVLANPLIPVNLLAFFGAL